MLPFFLERPAGRRFCVLFEPSDCVARRGGIVFAHPFAEEMNKSRRMVAEQARRFALAGWAVLLMDLAGCGDSSGEFEDATWADWIDDFRAARTWMANRISSEPVLWGLRAGALIAVEAVCRQSIPVQMLLWQPVVSGKQHLSQFLRSATVAGWNSDASVASGASLRKQLAEGRQVEVAGYRLHPLLASGLDQASLSALPAGSSVTWLEVAAGAAPTLAPASAARIAEWHGAGVAVTEEVLSGPPFWATVEITECPAMLQRSDRAVAAFRAASA